MKMVSSSKRIITFLALFFSSIFISCKKFVEVNPPINQFTAVSIFSNNQSATSAVVGLYQQMLSTQLLFSNGGLSLYTSLSADELKNTFSDISYDAFLKNSIASDESSVYTYFWTVAYKIIYQANAIIDGLNSSSGITADVKNQLIGETKFTRALCFFYLTNVFGDVPLQTTTDYRVNSVMPRSSSIKVYEQIVSDLTDAQNLLKSAYPTIGRTRPNKWAASALLSRVYLYQKNWSGAEAASSAVIGSGIYNLESNLNDVFLATSKEAIWQLQPLNEYLFTVEGSIFVPFTTTELPRFVITNNLFNSFEVNDQREIKWLGKNIVGGIDYYYPLKYKIKYPSGGPITEYNMVLRMAEQYLIRAEARAQQNNIPGAQIDLNAIRNRAGLGNTISTDKATLLLAIEQERRVELFAEWGHRWLDLKRTNRADVILQNVKAPNWQSTDVLYPIPFTELQLNTFLSQNPGY